MTPEEGMSNIIRDLFVKILKSEPEISIEDVSPNGDVIFSATIGDLGLSQDDLKQPIMRSRFFVNFIGELFVRGNISLFADILTGFDPGMYEKIICNCRHTDFGMYIDNTHKLVKWQMHISLVQQILTEDFDRVLDEIPEIEEEEEEVDEEEEISSEEDQD
jgi:hypothetical protein